MTRIMVTKDIGKQLYRAGYHTPSDMTSLKPQQQWPKLVHAVHTHTVCTCTTQEPELSSCSYVAEVIKNRPSKYVRHWVAKVCFKLAQVTQ